MAPKPIDPRVRFEKFFDKPEDEDACWVWKGALNASGYGTFAVEYVPWPAHRYSKFLQLGYEFGDLCVCHKCDNRACVNPDHLFLATREENNTDRHAKGRTYRGPPKPAKKPKAKLNEDKVREIRFCADSGLNYVEISKLYGVSSSQVHKIVNHLAWREIAL